MVAGVCGGIAEYFAMDPTVLRLAMALFALTGFGLIFYLVAIPIVPLEPEGKK